MASTDVTDSRIVSRSPTIYSSCISSNDWATRRATGKRGLVHLDGSHLLFALNKKRQKYRNLLREPRVAIAIADPANPYRALEIRGKVARIDADPAFHFINAATQKYFHRDATREETGAAEERVVVVVEPERVFPFPPQTDQKQP
jgi:PPOX class probable F420-dependent enzyme